MLDDAQRDGVRVTEAGMDADEAGPGRRSHDSQDTARPRPRLSRSQIMERLLTMNPSATAAFLERFDDAALATYLDHLVAAERPRGRDARWERPGDSPAIMVSTPGR